MCGIAGFLGARASEAAKAAALASIAHRGPDDEGVYQDGSVCLLHRRLSILDVTDRGHQPMVDPDTGVAIVFNGEIYNFRELKAKHGDAGYRTGSDTEVVLRLYIERGLDCVEELRGMFAIAIWDPRNQKLHLIRDRFGIKPVYWHMGSNGIAFGSEIKALLALGVKARLDYETVYDYLAHGLLAHSPRTFFQGVEALPPGSILTCSVGSAPTRRIYWSPTDHVASSPQTNQGQDSEAALWDMFREVLDMHMVSDVPVGLTLSSGLDSTFLLHVLAANGQKEMDAFTYGFADAAYDEIRRIDLQSLPLSIRHHTLTLQPEDTIGALERAVSIFETPIGGVGTLGLYRVLELAPQRGIKVVLAGEGSDEAFGGYRYYGFSRLRDLYERGDPRLSAESAAFSKVQGQSIIPGTAEFEKHVLQSDAAVWAPDGTLLAGEAFLGPALANCRPEDSWQRAQDWFPPIPAGVSHFRSALLRDLYVQKIPKLLWFQDRVSMAWGVESRVPFLDHKLFEFIGSLDDDWLIRDGVSKFALKRLYERYCHLDHSETRKHFVSTPQREWIRGPLAEQIKALVRDGELVRAGLIDLRRFERQYDEYCASADLGNSFFIWKVLNLELLLRTFFATADTAKLHVEHLN